MVLKLLCRLSYNSINNSNGRLEVEDIPLLEQIEEQQKELIKHAEKEMQHKSLNLDEVQRRIYKQCDKFIDELRRSDEITYPTNFAKILFQDVHVI